MALSRRREITELLVSQLKLINGTTSSFTPSYTYNYNVFNNVIRRNKFLDEINDFPTICIVAGTENRVYHSDGLTIGELDLTLRAYIRAENPISYAENLSEDIEHVIYNLGDRSDIGVLDIIIESISNDEGLVAPFGILEMSIIARYELNI